MSFLCAVGPYLSNALVGRRMWWISPCSTPFEEVTKCWGKENCSEYERYASGREDIYICSGVYMESVNIYIWRRRSFFSNRVNLTGAPKKCSTGVSGHVGQRRDSNIATTTARFSYCGSYGDNSAVLFLRRKYGIFFSRWRNSWPI